MNRWIVIICGSLLLLGCQKDPQATSVNVLEKIDYIRIVPAIMPVTFDEKAVREYLTCRIKDDLIEEQDVPVDKKETFILIQMNEVSDFKTHLPLPVIQSKFELHQVGKIQRSALKLLPSTYSQTLYGESIGESSNTEEAKKMIDQMMDDFLSLYRKANGINASPKFYF